MPPDGDAAHPVPIRYFPDPPGSLPLRNRFVTKAAMPPDGDAAHPVPIRYFPDMPGSLPLRNRFYHTLQEC